MKIILFYFVWSLCLPSLWGQNENKPVQRKIERSSFKIPLKIPDKNPPNFLQKDFI